MVIRALILIYERDLSETNKQRRKTEKTTKDKKSI